MEAETKNSQNTNITQQQEHLENSDKVNPVMQDPESGVQI